MTESELYMTKTWKALPIGEKQDMLRRIKTGDLDLAAAPSPGPDEIEPERGPLGIAPTQTGPPIHTGSYLEEYTKPFFSAFNDPTATETYLPKNIFTTALSGLERGTKAILSPVTGAGNVLGKLSEESPRLIGQPPVSGPASRVAPELPGLVLQGLLPVSGAGEAGGEVTGPGMRAEQFRRDAQAVGIPLTTAESTMGSPVGVPAQLATKVVGTTPTGARTIMDFHEQQLAAAQAAAARAGPMMAPEYAGADVAGLRGHEAASAQVRAAQEAEAARQSARAAQAGQVGQSAVTGFTQTLGPSQTSADYVGSVQKTLSDAETAARAGAKPLYDHAETLAGPAPAIQLQNVANEGRRIVDREAKMGALAQQPTLGVAATMKNLALQFVEDYHLWELKSTDYATARLLDERLGDKIAVAERSGEQSTARQLRLLQTALRKDIDAYAANEPGDVGQAMRTANEYYRTRVGEPFGPDSHIYKLQRTTEAQQLDNVLLNPTASERIQTIKTEMLRHDPNSWKPVEARFGQQLLNAAIDPTTGQFSTVKFTQELGRYTEESLNAILGDKAAEVNRLRARFQGTAAGPKEITDPLQAAAVFRAFAKAEPEIIVAGLAKRPMTELAQIKSVMRPDEWANLARAWWEERILKNSIGNTGVFSRTRFLTQLKDISPEYMRVLVGDEAAGHVETLRRVLQRQEEIHKIGDNPSGTAKLLIAGGQMVQGGQLAHSLMVGDVAGIAAGGAALLTPLVLAKMLVNPTGARLLVRAVRAMPDTREAMEASRAIAIYLAQKQTQAEQERRP